MYRFGRASGAGNATCALFSFVWWWTVPVGLATFSVSWSIPVDRYRGVVRGFTRHRIVSNWLNVGGPFRELYGSWKLWI